jgi:hypothetical protein
MLLRVVAAFKNGGQELAKLAHGVPRVVNMGLRLGDISKCGIVQARQ